MIVTILLDRPHARNALDLATLERVNAELDAARNARLVVLTGAGDKIFCSGADLSAVAGNPAARRDVARQYALLLARIASFERPIIARVNGHCLAGGMGLLLACDLAVSVDDATFSLPEAAVGLWPMMVGAFLIPTVGRRRALELALTGRKLSAAEAVEWGMVNRSVPRAHLDGAVADLTAAILARGPAAIRAGRAAWNESLEPRLLALADALGEVMDHAEAVEGLTAFLQKRPANWPEDPR